MLDSSSRSTVVKAAGPAASTARRAARAGRGRGWPTGSRGRGARRTGRRRRRPSPSSSVSRSTGASEVRESISRRTTGRNRRRRSSSWRASRRSSAASSSRARSASRVTRKMQGSTDVHPGEELVDEGHQGLLERDEPVPTGQGQQPGDVGRDLHPGEPDGVVLAVPDLHTDVEREVGDVGERVARVDRERGHHRAGSGGRTPRGGRPGRRAQRVPVAQLDPLGPQGRATARRPGGPPGGGPSAPATPGRRPAAGPGWHR
jgi:hypothetical protein